MKNKKVFFIVIGLIIVLFNYFSYAQTPADNFYGTFSRKPDGPAIGEVAIEWHSVTCSKCGAKCWQYYGNGTLYEDDLITIHNCGNEISIGDINSLMAIAVIFTGGMILIALIKKI